MKNLEGKIAVVTGGSSGIGLATAKRFVDEGAHVVITGRREKELKEAAALIKKNVTTVVGDVSRLEDLDRPGANARALGRYIGSTSTRRGPINGGSVRQFNVDPRSAMKGAAVTVSA